jgi:prepilin-type N-terminal cleavage/methylation domain-containing protein
MNLSLAYHSKKRGTKGFTLVEMLVSVAIFTFVMLIATSTIFTIIDSNKKAEALKSVMDNLNFALESMTRNIRTGSGYVCVDTGGNCPGGDSAFRFTSNQSSGVSVEYFLSNGQIMQDESDWTSGPLPITAAEIHVSSLEFYLVGSAAHDGIQPRVLMSVQGSAGAAATQTQFKIQTTLSERQIDS